MAKQPPSSPIQPPQPKPTSKPQAQPSPQPPPRPANSSPSPVLPSRKEVGRQEILVRLVTIEGTTPSKHTTKVLQFWTKGADEKPKFLCSLNGESRPEDHFNGGLFFHRGMAETNLWEALAKTELMHPVLNKPAAVGGQSTADALANLQKELTNGS